MIVLDTHIWLWWLQQSPKLKPDWQDLIDTEERVGVSAISCFEVAWLVRHDRIRLTQPLELWFEMALEGSAIELLPITPLIAQRSVALPEHHRDPQDRLIIATALQHRARLISADEKFSMYDELDGDLVP